MARDLTFQPFSGVGIVTMYERNADGTPKAGFDLGEAPVFKLTQQAPNVEMNTTRSADRGVAFRMAQSKGASLEIQLKTLNDFNLELITSGVWTETAATAAVVGWSAPADLVVGNVIKLPARNVSAVTVKDSTGGGAKVLPAASYELDAVGGTIKLLDITTGGPYVQPFKADYTPGAVKVLGGLKATDKEYNLRDPATVRAFESENKSRAQIVKKFADERAAYVIAKDKEIAAARLAGDAATEAKLAEEKRAALAVQADAEKDALRKFTADETLTRIAQVKERYSRELALLQDRIGREAQLNQEQFELGLRDLATYLAERGQLEQQATASELQQLQTKLAEQRRVLALNESRAGSAKTANEQEQLRETILQQQQDILRTETEIEKKKRDQVDAARQLANEAERYRRELAATLRGVEEEIAQLGGTETAQQIEARVTAALLPTLERVKQLGGDASRVFLLIDMKVQQEQFRQAERAYADHIERLQLLERGLDDQVQMGALTTVEAEAQKFEARARALPQLREMLSILNATAQTEGDRNRITQITQDLDRLADRSTELERTMRSSIGTGIGQALTDVQLRSKTAGEAIKGFFSDIARSALNVVNQRLGEQIANTLFPKAGSGDGFMGYVQQLFSKLGSWVTELFSSLGSGGGGGGGNFLSTAATWVASLFHSGGLVGQSSGMSRAVSPAAWAYAPRYHTEGIVGLKPRERAIIALDGEEVLREDNPRHIKNFGRTSSVGNVDISVAVQVTSGDQAQAKASGDAMAQDLAQMVDARISTWAAREQRPGGVLQQGGRR
ncbi:hypothetical protein MW290_12040 [Aquincola tertiaricarbonis]|uniref:Uncharacterized protein n=1 Tax=Aquincola tertiaricarbonis TaxID=391953 RepID=A0ABY4S428_AQUTE|nr:hypothetical protein [Aquincola tertiaricarbonis]URI06627.1 hypothetical protein MW290_12040 [Aquincola tertiaricarbonis]